MKIYDLIATVRYFGASVNSYRFTSKNSFFKFITLKRCKKIAKPTQNTQRLFNTVINYVYSSKI